MKKIFTLFASMVFAIVANADVQTWDFSTFTEQVVLADENKIQEYDGLTLCGSATAGYTNDYVSATAGFHMNGTSSTTTRYISYTPTKDGDVTVYYRSNNATAVDRITAIGTEVVKGSSASALMENEKVLAVGLTDGATLKSITASLTAGTTYYFYFANGGQSIMKIEYSFTSASSVDFSALQQKISEASAIENPSEALKEAIAAAGDVLDKEGVTQEEVDQAVQDLTAAIGSATSIKAVSVEATNIAKAMVNGKVVIVKGAKQYNVAGQEL